MNIQLIAAPEYENEVFQDLRHTGFYWTKFYGELKIAYFDADEEWKEQDDTWNIGAWYIAGRTDRFCDGDFDWIADNLLSPPHDGSMKNRLWLV